MAKQIRGHGVSATLPDGWSGRVFRDIVSAPERIGPTMHAGNFAIPPNDTGFAGSMMSQVDAGRVALVYLEYLPDNVLRPRAGLYSQVGFPAPFKAEDFDSRILQAQRPGQAGVQRFVTVGDRLIVLFAVINQQGDVQGAISTLNDLLGSVQLASSPEASDYGPVSRQA